MLIGKRVLHYPVLHLDGYRYQQTLELHLNLSLMTALFFLHDHEYNTHLKCS